MRMCLDTAKNALPMEFSAQSGHGWFIRGIADLAGLSGEG